MNDKPYPKYKESGVQWLGEVPEHWEVKRLKTSVTYRVSSVDKLVKEDELPVKLCNYTDVYYNDFITQDMSFMEATATPDEIHRFSLRVHDIVLTKDSEDWRDIAVPAYIESTAPNIVCGYHLAIVSPNLTKVDGKYLLRCFQSNLINQQFQVMAGGVTRFGLPKSAIGNAIFPIPPKDEQTAIADFLDRETGRIDTLVAKNKKLIELLKEERSALISRTVTRGLPEDVAIEYGLEPHTRFKESGVEWLGDVPEDWEVWKLAHLTKRIGSGKTPTGGAEVYQNEGVIFLRSQNVYDDGLYLDDVVYIDQKIDEEMAWSRVQGQDILLNITGASLGRTCIVPNELPKSNVNQHVCVIRLNNTDSAEYISLYLKSKPAKAFYDFVQTGSAREGLNFQQIGTFPIPLPLLPEQQAIAAYLDRETAKIDKLIEKVVALITRLQEYRIAIITDAVTGKIDVREMVAA